MKPSPMQRLTAATPRVSPAFAFRVVGSYPQERSLQHQCIWESGTEERSGPFRHSWRMELVSITHREGRVHGRACQMCLRSVVEGTASFTTEIDVGQNVWKDVSPLHEFSLCSEHYDRVVSLVDRAVSPFREGETTLGMPMAEAAISLGTGHCETCQSRLQQLATSLELRPLRVQVVARRRNRRVGPIRRLRLCRPCFAWWLGIFRDSSFVNGVGYRFEEGEAGSWNARPHGDVAYYSIGSRNESIVRATAAATGHRARRVLPHTMLQEGEVCIVGAGQSDRATRFMAAVPAGRHRYAILCRPDQIADAQGALLLGAGELLSSPLSPQQVVGAAIRCSRPGPAPHDSISGLPLLDDSEAPSSFTDIFAAPKPGEHPIEAALLLRKFLRGWDEVGGDGRGGVRARLAAGPEEAARVVERLGWVLGSTFRLEPAREHLLSRRLG